MPRDAERHQQLTDELTAVIKADIMVQLQGRCVSVEDVKLALVDAVTNLDLAPPDSDLLVEIDRETRQVRVAFTTYDLNG